MSFFNTILNTVPRPILIKVSYWVRPIISLYLKGNTYTDPIDGKSFRNFYPTVMANKDQMFYRQVPFL